MNEMMSEIQATPAEETAAAAPHELGCFQVALERVTEQAHELGLMFAGDIDEVWRSRTLADHAHERLAINDAECECASRWVFIDVEQAWERRQLAA